MAPYPVKIQVGGVLLRHGVRGGVRLLRERRDRLERFATTPFQRAQSHRLAVALAWPGGELGTIWSEMLDRAGQRTIPDAIDAAAVDTARAAVPDEALITGVVEAFQTLADPTRVRILYALTRGPLCVRDLGLVVGVSESAVSHQLRLLRERRLVKTDRRGNVITYTLDDHHIGVLFREAEYHADHVRQNLADHPYR